MARNQKSFGQSYLLPVNEFRTLCISYNFNKYYQYSFKKVHSVNMQRYLTPVYFSQDVATFVFIRVSAWDIFCCWAESYFVAHFVCKMLLDRNISCSPRFISSGEIYSRTIDILPTFPLWGTCVEHSVQQKNEVERRLLHHVNFLLGRLLVSGKTVGTMFWVKY